MNQYLSQEIEICKDFIKEADIAKFIIQSFTGPFHKMRERPNVIQVAENIREEYRTKRELVKYKEVYQQISENCLKIHIIPFLRKYKSVNLLANLFTENFEYFSPDFIEPISPSKIDSILSGYSSFNKESVKSIINTFNLYGETPHHSESYRDNFHPSYMIVLNAVIKKYMRVL
jgi:hypothetical protein